MKEFPDGRYGPNPPASEVRIKDMGLEQHRELGRKIRLFRLELMSLYRTLYRAKGGDVPKARTAAERTLHHLNELRNRMDNIVCHDHNAYNNAHKIYYGMEGLDGPKDFAHREEIGL